eukprot:Rhum_TRINITY_DN14796_c10_g1::Rhum_TRINITY_DN14796_c10_g1_i3::g.118965::m.118965
MCGNGSGVGRWVGSSRRLATLRRVPRSNVDDAVGVRRRRPRRLAHSVDRRHRRLGKRVDSNVTGLTEDLELAQTRRVDVHRVRGLVRVVVHAVQSDRVRDVRAVAAAHRRHALLAQVRAAPDGARLRTLAAVEGAVEARHRVLRLLHLALDAVRPARRLVVVVDGRAAVRRPAHQDHVHLLIPVHQVPRVLLRRLVPVDELLPLVPAREPLADLTPHTLHVVRGVARPDDLLPQHVDQVHERVRVRHQAPRRVLLPALPHHRLQLHPRVPCRSRLEPLHVRPAGERDAERGLAHARVAHPHVADPRLHVVEPVRHALDDLLELLLPPLARRVREHHHLFPCPLVADLACVAARGRGRGNSGSGIGRHGLVGGLSFVHLPAWNVQLSNEVQIL